MKKTPPKKSAAIAPSTDGDKQILAPRYQMYLPTEEELRLAVRPATTARPRRKR